MADRTAFQLTVYECPVQQRGAVLAVLSQYQLSGEWGGASNFDTLFVGADTRYVSEQMCCGTIGQIATAIIAAAPGATFGGWEDPRYEWLGEYHAYTPSLGHFICECDADGNPVLAVSHLLREIGQAESLPALKATVEALSGAAWRAEIAGHLALDNPPAKRGNLSVG